MTGDIDSTIPIGLMHLVDRSAEVIHQHGGIATSVAFDSLEEMTIDEFVRDYVPKLKGDNSTFTIIKDSTREQLFRILGDNVARYHIKSIKDVFYDQLIERLMSDQEISLTPNLSFPLIQWSVKKESGMKSITVEIPPRQFAMHLQGFKEPFVVWHPTLWMKIEMTSANVPNQVYLGCVQQHLTDFNNEYVMAMPFPNVFGYGGICWGGTSYDVPQGMALTENAALMMTYNRYFNSEFNYDLLDNQDKMHFREIYEKMPKNDKIDKLLKKYSGSGDKEHMLYLAAVFAVPENLNKFKYRRLMKASEFLGMERGRR